MSISSRRRFRLIRQQPVSGTALGIACAFILSLVIQWQHLVPRADDPKLLEVALSNAPLEPDWGPIYLLFLRSLFQLSPDKLIVFRIAIIIISLLNAVLIFFWIHNRSGNRMVSLFFTSFYLYSGFSLFAAVRGTGGMIPPPSSASGHFAMCFVIAGLLVLERAQRNDPHFLAASSLCFVIAAYGRPEFLLVAVAACAWTVVTLIMRWNQPSTHSPMIVRSATIAVAAVILFLVLALGLPLPSSDRALVAFGQHVALGFCVFHRAICASDFNIFSHWTQYYGMLFPDSQSIFVAAITYPGAFIAHLGQNFLLTARIIFSGVFYFFLKPIALPILSFSTFAILCWRLKTEKMYRRWQRTDLRLLAFVILAAAPQLASWFLLYPRLHYMATPFVLACGMLLSFSPAPDLRAPKDG